MKRGPARFGLFVTAVNGSRVPYWRASCKAPGRRITRWCHLADITSGVPSKSTCQPPRQHHLILFLAFAPKLGHRTPRRRPLPYPVHVRRIRVRSPVILIACCIVGGAHAWRRRVLLSCRPLGYIPPAMSSRPRFSQLTLPPPEAPPPPMRHLLHRSAVFQVFGTGE